MNNFALNRLKQLFATGIECADGQWLDLYNLIVNAETSGTILTTIDSSNNFWIMEKKKKGIIRRLIGSVAVTVAKRDNTQNFVMIPSNTADGQTEMELGGVCDLSYPSSTTRRGRVQDGGKTTPALTTHTEANLRRIETGYRVRKLTPRECFRLMGVSDEDIDKLIAAGISNSQLYKLAGNSIVVNCLAGIWRQLFVKNENTNTQLEIF